jgi:hypothetical protein
LAQAGEKNIFTMHNLDYSFPNYNAGGSQQEWEYDGEQGAYGASYEWENEYENSEGEYEDEYEHDGEYEDEGEYADNEWEAEYEGDSQSESPFSEEEEMELATELLNVNNEEELDQFFGGLLSAVAGPLLGKAASWIGKKLKGRAKRLSRRAVRRLGRGLKKIAKTTVQGVAGSTTDAIPGGEQSDAAELYGLELEGLSQEDQEFEVAKRFINLAGEAIQQAAMLEDQMPPDEAVDAAFNIAASKYAPGLLAPAVPPRRPPSAGRRRSGRWMRQGRNIAILNAY